MPEFKPNQVIRAKRATKSAYGDTFAQGARLVVANVDRNVLRLLRPAHTLGVNTVAGHDKAPDNAEYLVDPADFEPVPVPKWSDVEPGDKVVFRVRETGEEFTTTATQSGDPHRAAIMGLRLGLGLPSNRWEVVSIEKPKPKPPTTPGSHITVPWDWDSGVNHLFLKDDGRWMSQTGNDWSAMAASELTDFTVIHDAGEAS